ncbi:MAG: hypothetical protein HKM93_21210 [Desulfobacteraceae bacterium]|nr:hypothetical protein [Desulfobacteraceae bacterium]
MRLKKQLDSLINQARSWNRIDLLLDDDGFPQKEYSHWQKQVEQALRQMPDAKTNVVKFIRLQKYYNASWTIDLGNFDTRLELVKKSIARSIEFLESIYIK